MTPEEYTLQALHTLYPDLTLEQRLGLCGLGLSGEVGEVTDILKKYLYHHNGKELDINKIKDELGDIMWYFSILCNTLGFSIEDTMIANVNKLSKRHQNGFTPRYTSDSGMSE